MSFARKQVRKRKTDVESGRCSFASLLKKRAEYEAWRE